MISFSCPYSADLDPDDGGCPNTKSWTAKEGRSTRPDEEAARKAGDIHVVYEDAATCSSCERVGVADADKPVVIVAKART